jgi:type III pantothenate kinase
VERTLAITIGNSNTAVGIAEGGRWLGRFRVRTVPERMPDDYLILFDGLLGRLGLSVRSAGRPVLASVVPQTTEKVLAMIEEAGGSGALVVGPGIDTGIAVRIDNPAEIGADLVANAVAAFSRHHSRCIVVDFGTALSLTAVASPGELRGVAIAPGLHYAVRALAQNTAQLPTVPLTMPPAAIGTNTVHAIQSGVVFGYVGMVEYLVERIKRELPAPTAVVATGGQVGVIAPLTGCFTAAEPWLTLEGLRLIAERNPG